MKPETLKNLVKKDLVQHLLHNIDRAVYEANKSKSSFGQELTGSHSWYVDVVNNVEDIRISSLMKILGLLQEEFLNQNIGPINLKAIFSDELMHRAQLLNYLSSTNEKADHLNQIIAEYKDTFTEIRRSLDNLYNEDKLGNKDLNQGYIELKKTLKEMESEDIG